MSTATNYTVLETARFERKFVLENSNIAHAKMLVKINPGMFSSIYTKRRINNIYFDTPNLTSYYDNHFGKSERIKIRIRWYGETLGHIAEPILEYKMKHGAAGTKNSFTLKGFTLNNEHSSFNWKALFQESDLPDNVQNDLKSVIPTLLNSYERMYFQSFNKNYRFTIDFNLSFFNIKSLRNNFLEKALKEPSIILELKYDLTKDENVKKITNALPVRLNKYSKYIRGIESFYPHLAV
jgi:SPX domain protein involved in polyphosphate accumulation